MSFCASAASEMDGWLGLASVAVIPFRTDQSMSIRPSVEGKLDRH